jgi:hypothetical protein
MLEVLKVEQTSISKNREAENACGEPLLETAFRTPALRKLHF